MPSSRQPERSLRPAIATIAALALAATGGSFLTAEATTSQTELVSVSSAGVQGNGPSGERSPGAGGPPVSADGRYVAFDSLASNLVPNDTNRVRDVFVRDRFTQETQRVSVGNGRQANKQSRVLDISATGRYVVFASSATNLVRRDAVFTVDVFVRDRRLRRTTRVSVTDRGLGGNNHSRHGVISANGRFVAFSSSASNLVRGDTNGSFDVFVRDRRRGTTRRVSVNSREAQAGSGVSPQPAMSADGRLVAFPSSSTNLVRGDTNRRIDVFVRDRVTKTTSRVSVRTGGRQFADGSSSPDISPGGRFVVFQTGVETGTNFEFRIHRRDRRTGQTRLISPPGPGLAPPYNFGPSVSANGRFVAFTSNAPLPGEDPNDGSFDALVTDLQLGTTSFAALTATGAKVSQEEFQEVKMSDDGRWVVFGSTSNTVVPEDTNRTPDVFIHRR
jgi:Tol biopolymer transport system component